MRNLYYTSCGRVMCLLLRSGKLWRQRTYTGMHTPHTPPCNALFHFYWLLKNKNIFKIYVTSIWAQGQEFYVPKQMSKTFKQLSDKFKLSSEATLNQVQFLNVIKKKEVKKQHSAVMQLSEILNERMNICSVALQTLMVWREILLSQIFKNIWGPCSFNTCERSSLKMHIPTSKSTTTAPCQTYVNKQQNKLLIIFVIFKTLLHCVF